MSNIKDIKDYLHYYLGCEVECPHGKGMLISVSNYDHITVTGDGDKYYKPKEVKPILRPLSDMTEEEGREYAQHYGIKGHHPVTITEENGYVKVSIGYKDHMASLFPLSPHGQKPESLHYLLSKHFDLFGLIESNLAIDKSKLKQ